MSWVREEVGRKLSGYKVDLTQLTGLLGIYGPGYQERRRERIKNRYGIDVSTTAANQS